MKKDRKFLVVFSVFLAFMLLAGMLTGCSVGPDKGNEATDVPATENATAVVTSAPTEKPAPTAEPTPTPDPTPTPEPTEKPDYSGGIVKENPKRYSFFGRQGTGAFCGTGHRIAVQFYATAEFVELGFHSPTWTATSGYSVDYELYEWDKDYETTVYDHEPVLTGHFENWQDGVLVALKTDGLPAGEYVLLALYASTEDMHNGGVWHDTDVEREDQISYVDDEIWYDRAVWFEIKYAVTPKNLYGPLSDPGV
jgi:hypothetical protein